MKAAYAPLQLARKLEAELCAQDAEAGSEERLAHKLEAELRAQDAEAIRACAAAEAGSEERPHGERAGGTVIPEDSFLGAERLHARQSAGECRSSHPSYYDGRSLCQKKEEMLAASLGR